MADLDRLLLRREHFPIDIRETTGYKGKRFWDFGRIEIPPYHPLIAENGIDFESVPVLLYEAVEGTVRDLEEIADKRRDIQALLQDVTKDEKSGRVLYEPEITVNESGIEIGSVPVVGHFWIGRRGMNPYSYNGDQGISINPEIAAKSFNVPEQVEFSPELMTEYEMTDGGILLGKRRIECPNGWYRHNLANINAIFYKNLVTALDNAIVRDKYADKTPTSSE